MNTEQLQTRHAELQQNLVKLREQQRQIEQQAEDLHNGEQQLIGAISIIRELLQVAAHSTPVSGARLTTEDGSLLTTENGLPITTE